MRNILNIDLTDSSCNGVENVMGVNTFEIAFSLPEQSHELQLTVKRVSGVVDTIDLVAVPVYFIQNIGTVYMTEGSGTVEVTLCGHTVAIEVEELTADDDILIKKTANGFKATKVPEEDNIQELEEKLSEVEGKVTEIEEIIAPFGEQKVLWSGAYNMHAGHTINFSEKVSEQANGIIFVWSYYSDSAASDAEFHYFYVPKFHIANFNGRGVNMNDAFLGMYKYIYIYDSYAKGYTANGSSGTVNGISYNNTKFVLRYVLGV